MAFFNFWVDGSWVSACIKQNDLSHSHRDVKSHTEENSKQLGFQPTISQLSTATAVTIPASLEECLM